MTALIDADSIIYILAYQYRDEQDIAEAALKSACDHFLHSICTLVHADKYVGVFSSSENFRHTLYKYKPYKGNRPPKPEFITKWEPTIREHFMSKWSFYRSPDLEADDIVAALSVLMEDDTVICSPDKDLKQMAGLYFNYSKNEAPVTITATAAKFQLWSQVLTGDSSDNIAGLPGLGPKKVTDLFATIVKENDETELMNLVSAQYLKYFGEYYGPIIFAETLQTVMLMQPEHPLWEQYKGVFGSIISGHCMTAPESVEEDIHELALDELGWLE